jgi:broad specificity phosphatase PhoE
MRTLIVARHGLALSNREGGSASCSIPGEGLTPEGAAQARALGEALAPERIDLGVATELCRTQDTLELALAGRDVPMILLPELNEINFGRFDGGPLDDYRGWAFSAPPDEPAPGGGESRAQAAERFARGLGRLLSRDEDVIVVVGHALVLRYVLDAAESLVPAARITPLAHAVPHRLSAEQVSAAAELLDAWSKAPRFRDPSKEGWAAADAGRPSRA